MQSDNTILEIIGKGIKERRAALGLSQEKLAEISGVDRSFICGVECGNNNVSVLTLCQLIQALGMDFLEFVSSLPQSKAE